MATQPLRDSVVIVERARTASKDSKKAVQPIDLSGDTAEIAPGFKEPGKILHEASCFAPYVVVHCGFLGETRTTIQCMFSCADSAWSNKLRNETRSNCDIYDEAMIEHDKVIERLEANQDCFFDLRDIMV